VAIPIAQGNRPELLRQTPVPASPPRVSGPDDGCTGRRRRREGGRILSISGGNSILRREHDRNWRAKTQRPSGSRPSSRTNECRARAVELLERRRAVAGVNVHANQHLVGQATPGRVDGPVARVAFRLSCDKPLGQYSRNRTKMLPVAQQDGRRIAVGGRPPRMLAEVADSVQVGGTDQAAC
jgi:hypothetical protein